MQPAAFAGMDQALRDSASRPRESRAPEPADGRCARAAHGRPGGGCPLSFRAQGRRAASWKAQPLNSSRLGTAGPAEHSPPGPSSHRGGEQGWGWDDRRAGLGLRHMASLQVPAIECSLTCYSACYQAPSFSPPKPSCRVAFRLSGVGSCRSRASFKGCPGGRRL